MSVSELLKDPPDSWTTLKCASLETANLAATSLTVNGPITFGYSVTCNDKLTVIGEALFNEGISSSNFAACQVAATGAYPTFAVDFTGSPKSLRYRVLIPGVFNILAGATVDLTVTQPNDTAQSSVWVTNYARTVAESFLIISPSSPITGNQVIYISNPTAAPIAVGSGLLIDLIYAW